MKTLLLISMISPVWAASPEAEQRYTLPQVIASPEWSCKYTSKATLGVDMHGDPKSLPPMCMADVRCEGRGKKSGAWKTFVTSCMAKSAGVCPDLRECVDEIKYKANLKHPYDWSTGREQGSKEDTSKQPDKYGRHCVYSTKYPMVLYRATGPESMDEVCATPIKCDQMERGPKHSIVACAPTDKTVFEEIDGKQVEFTVCPKVNQCIENELPLTRAHSASEYGQLQPRTTPTQTHQGAAPPKTGTRPASAASR